MKIVGFQHELNSSIFLSLGDVPSAVWASSTSSSMMSPILIYPLLPASLRRTLSIRRHLSWWLRLKNFSRVFPDSSWPSSGKTSVEDSSGATRSWSKKEKDSPSSSSSPKRAEEVQSFESSLLEGLFVSDESLVPFPSKIPMLQRYSSQLELGSHLSTIW